jgi:hypothetical protein
MIALLNDCGTVDSDIDLLMICVMIGRILGMHCFKRDVGRGSSRQDLDDEFKMISRISFCVAGEKAVSDCPTKSISESIA